MLSISMEAWLGGGGGGVLSNILKHSGGGGGGSMGEGAMEHSKALLGEYMEARSGRVLWNILKHCWGSLWKHGHGGCY